MPVKLVEGSREYWNAVARQKVRLQAKAKRNEVFWHYELVKIDTDWLDKWSLNCLYCGRV